MHSNRWSILVFVLGVLSVLGALGWVTFHTLRLERAEQAARADARHQEKVRLALWRMDAMIAPILAREAARPYFEYRSFYPADTAYTRLLSKVAPGEVLVPSPLLQPSDPYVKLHFELVPSQEPTSPQVPSGHFRQLAESVYVSGYRLMNAEQSLEQLRGILSAGTSFRSSDRQTGLDQAALGPRVQAELSSREGGPAPQTAPVPANSSRSDDASPETQNVYEYQTRQRSVAQATKQQAAAPPAGGPLRTSPRAEPRGKQVPQESDAAGVEALARDAETLKREDAGAAEPLQLGGAPAPASPLTEPGGLEAAPAPGAASSTTAEPVLLGPGDAGVVQREFVPSWVGPAGRQELIYTRKVEAPSVTFEQGFWVDWTSLRAALLADIEDLLPGAELSPLQSLPEPSDVATLGRTLASLPAQLVAPTPELVGGKGGSPVRTTLLVTWVAAIGAVLAIALVLRASLELAERRGRFVSAVTHELRTPLTTFCLYSQMLADGMVPTEEARRSYVRTLNTESQRLARIVESVLDYARLGKPRGRSRRGTIAAGALVERLIPTLTARAEQGGMTLKVHRHTDLHGNVSCDADHVERILFNLVDNACKYAGGGDDRRIDLTVEATRNDLTLTVRDYGPGIEAKESRRVFRPFFRGLRHADGSTPGLGLGLALAHGLSRECGGDLRLTGTRPGAEFRLRLPLAL